ncbi:MAG: cytochrome c3 family protein [Acidobacteriota bacterium]
MKKALFILLSLAVAAFVYSAIAGTAHDFSGETWTVDGRICLPCHTPHNGSATVGTPLWNHDETAGATTYTLYSGPGTLDATLGQPSGVSRLCMGCHDGTVALDSFGGTVGTDFLTVADPGFLGTDLSNDHPISFTYDTTLSTTDGELHDPATANSGLGGTIAADMLFSGSMECSSCHDVHGVTGVSNLLIKANTGSALCLTCHDK